MIIQPKIWGFICTTAHPLGCERNVRDQIERARQRVATGGGGPRNVLVIGASTGYGLAARITAAFGYGAATLGVFLEKPASATRTASAGWYNSAAVHQYAGHAGLACVSINADAFAAATRACAIDAIQRQLGSQVDLVIYSLAAPVRRLPDGSTARTALKPIDATFIAKTIDTDRDAVKIGEHTSELQSPKDLVCRLLLEKKKQGRGGRRERRHGGGEVGGGVMER